MFDEFSFKSIYPTMVAGLQNLCMWHTYVHRTTLTYAILKFAVRTCTLHFAFVSILEKSYTTLTLPAVHHLLYIFSANALLLLIVKYFAS